MGEQTPQHLFFVGLKIYANTIYFIVVFRRHKFLDNKHSYIILKYLLFIMKNDTIFTFDKINKSVYNKNRK